MCNRYASDIRKAGLEKEYYGFEEWSETRITPRPRQRRLRGVSEELRPSVAT